MFDFDDRHLIYRTQAGNTEAFNPLVEKYHTRVYTHILQKVKNPEIAKDLTQDTWLKAYRAIHTFRGESAFYSWIYSIAENVLKDNFRRQKHHNTIEPLHLIADRHLLETHPSPCRDLERQELREHLQAAVDNLTHTRKKVFEMYYLQELTIKAIATRLNKAEGTIKTHLRNARLYLRELLLPYVRNEPM